MGAADRMAQNRQLSDTKTLGDILYADRNKIRVCENEWVGLLRTIADGDQNALHSLFQKMHRIVFTLILRIIASPAKAEEVTIGVFHDVWRKAATYDPAHGSVVGWIMTQARCRAIDRLRFDQRKKRLNTYPQSLLPTTDMVAPQQAALFEDETHLLAIALEVLTPKERQVIETCFLSELTYEEAAAKLNQPPGTVKTRIRSGLRKLRNAAANLNGAMKAKQATHTGEHLDFVFLYALHALPPRSISIVEDQISTCKGCQQEMKMVRPIVRSFAGWPTDILRPAESLWGRLAKRIADEKIATQPFVVPLEAPVGPQWEQVAPGINVQILARNIENDSVSMLVRLDPRTDYPGHTHAGVEELHLLHGTLKVDDRTLYPGDFIHAEAGTVDHRVWSETGCTCVLMTSTKDVIA